MSENKYRYNKESGDIIRVNLGQNMEFFFHNDGQALAIYQGLVPNQENNDVRCFTEGYSVEAFKAIEDEAYKNHTEPPKNVEDLSKEDILNQMKKDYDSEGPAAILNTIITLGMMRIFSEGLSCHAYGSSNEEQKRLRDQFYNKREEINEERI